MFKIIWSTTVLVLVWGILLYSTGNIPGWITTIHLTVDDAAYAAIGLVTAASCLVAHARRIKN